MRPLFNDIMKKQGKWIRVYVGVEESQDPYEKNVVVRNTNPIPVRAIVEDMTTAQAQWKMPGRKVSKIKDITIEARWKSLIEKSSKIEFEGEMYEGWREDGKMQMREQPGVGGAGYLQLYIYTKGV
jgi:hypothetical protein